MDAKKKRIIETFAAIEKSYNNLNSFNDSLHQQYQELFITKELVSYLVTDLQNDAKVYNEYQNYFSSHTVGYAGLFAKLQSLTELYTNFLLAYLEMEREMDRQEQFRREYEQLKAKYQIKLDTQYNNELKQRENFNKWKEFLPPTLAPLVNKLPPKAIIS